MNRSIVHNPPLLALAAGLRSALFPIPVITIFWKEEIGMSFADIMLLQAIFGATTVLLEFPSGYVADRIGYRLSLITGAVFWVLGWIVYAMGTTFAAMVCAEVILGIGLAFTSGADSALLYVSVKARDGVQRYVRWEGRVRAASQISEAISSGLGGWLYGLSPRLPIWLQVPVALAGLGAVAATKEAERESGGGRIAHLAHAWHIVRHALIHRARLRAAMLLSVALGISTYMAVWFIQPWMQRRGIPLQWFGPLWAFAHLWLAGVSLLSARLGESLGTAGVLLLCCVLTGFSYLGLGFSDAAIGIGFYLGFMTVRGLHGPLLAAVLQNDAPAEDRASVLSLNALLFRLAAAVVLPPIGVATDHWGLEFLLRVLGFGVTAIALAAWFLFVRARAKVT
jgi:MFS family permease